MPWETRIDDDALATGTHGGEDGASALYDKGKNFDVYITPGVDCYNDTQGLNGSVLGVTENTVTVEGVTWDNGDIYSIYCTSAKNSFISSFRIDKVYGRKLTETYSEEDPDPDMPGDEFAPGQPDRRHR